MSSKQIILIKHGETEENQQGIHQGRAVGGTLSRRGRGDVLRTGGCLAARGINVDRMLVSPMARCRQSADLLAPLLRPAVIGIDERLAAKDSGPLAGRPRQAAMDEARRMGVPIHRLRTPGGESSEDVQARYVRLYQDVATGPDRSIVLVGHGGGIACLLLHLTGAGFDRYLEHVPASAAVTWHGNGRSVQPSSVPPKRSR
jgi:broad specificity phosphatase PhoE